MDLGAYDPNMLSSHTFSSQSSYLDQSWMSDAARPFTSFPRFLELRYRETVENQGGKVITFWDDNEMMKKHEQWT